MTVADRYQSNLSKSRQRGEGVHGYIMSTVTLGAYAGLGGGQIFSDLRRVLSRQVSDREIQDAIRFLEAT
jgi:hypothetical protein